MVRGRGRTRLDPAPADDQLLGVNGRAGRHVGDVLCLVQGLEQLVLCHQDGRLELAERSARVDGDRDAGAGDVVRRLDQGEPVAGTEGEPEALQLAAGVLEDPADGLGAVLRAVNQLGPDLRRVIESRHIKRHNTPY